MSFSVGAVLLAAGCSSRMEDGRHKLLIEIGGMPLVRLSASTLLKSKVVETIAITGHRRNEVQEALKGLPLTTAFNPAYADGLGATLAFAFSHQRLAKMDGILIMLADMPRIRSEHVDQLIHQFQAARGAEVVRGAAGAVPGHPVVLPSCLYRQVRSLSGDTGANSLIGESGLPVRMCDLDMAALCDVDTVDDALRECGRPFD